MHGLSLGQVIFHNMKKFENNIAQYIAETDESDTYGELLTRCKRTALKLKDIGITADDIVSSCTYNHRNSCVPFIAAQFIGTKAATFDPNLSPLDTIYLLKLIQPKVIFVSSDSVPFIETCLLESGVETELVVFGFSETYTQFSEYLKPHSDEDQFEPEPPTDPKTTAAIFFSSGTTGFPKGICLSHKALIGQSCNDDPLTANQTDGNSPGVTLAYTTCYWISAILILMKAIMAGGARVVCSKFDPAEAWNLIEKYKVTLVFVAPYHATDIILNRNKDADVSSLSVIATGSCLVTKKLMEDLKESFPNAKPIQGYGQTENSGVTASFNPSDPEEYALQERKPESCGKIKLCKWKVVDPETEEILGPNQRGELRVQSEFMMNGYYNMDSSSALDSEGYLKTGDIVYYDEDECFFVVDRIKEMFKYRGWHILPAIIETVVMNHPAVKECVVIGIPHERDGEHPMALVVLKSSVKDVTPKEIEKYVEERVKDSQRLRAGVKFIGGMVRTTTGKVRRNLMRQMVQDGSIYFT